MVAFAISGCYIMIFLLLTLVSVFKLLSSLVDALKDMVYIIGGVLLVILAILGCYFIAAIASLGFWPAVWTIVGLATFFSLVATLLGSIFSIILMLGEFVVIFLAAVFQFLYFLLDKAGEYLDLGLKYFLGVLKNQVQFS